MNRDIKAFIENWLAAANAYDTRAYLAMYHKDAILDDPSVGSIFEGHAGIKRYFDTYFIGYKTQTKLLKLATEGTGLAHLEVEFTGEFPERRIRGTFDLTFKDGLILSVKADLM